MNAIPSDFYLTVSSNAGTKFYPTNTLSHFWNKCAEPLALGSAVNWKVGLADLQLPLNWDSRPSVVQKILYAADDEKLEYDLNPDDFSDAYTLIKQIKNATKTHPFFKTAVMISYNQSTGMIYIQLRPRTVIIATPFLLDVLGIQGQENHTLGHKTSSEGRVYQGLVDTDVRYRTLWLYSNVCEHRGVGDTRAPLLRTIPVFRERGHVQMYIAYDRPWYIPVSGNYFPAIEILINNTAGEIVPFRPGQVVATLHFKKRA